MCVAADVLGPLVWNGNGRVAEGAPVFIVAGPRETRKGPAGHVPSPPRARQSNYNYCCATTRRRCTTCNRFVLIPCSADRKPCSPSILATSFRILYHVRRLLYKYYVVKPSYKLPPQWDGHLLITGNNHSAVSNTYTKMTQERNYLGEGVDIGAMSSIYIFFLIQVAKSRYLMGFKMIDFKMVIPCLE